MTKPAYDKLVRMPKHPHYYLNPSSGKIVYRRTFKGQHIKIRTGESAIQKAKDFVEFELEKRRTGDSDATLKRRAKGETNPNLEVVWLEFVETRKVGRTDATILTYNKTWNVGLAPFWKDKHCSDLTDAMMTQFRAWYLKEHPTRQADRTMIHFNLFVKYLFKTKLIRVPPDLSEINDIPVIVEKNARRVKVGRVFTDEEIAALLDSHNHIQLPHHEHSDPKRHARLMRTRLKLGIRLGLRGLRKMEAMSLKRSDVDLKKKLIKLWATKTSVWREVPINDELIEVFKEQYAESTDSEWVFPMESDFNRHLSGQVFDNVWNEARDVTGILPKFTGDARFHDLRHTFATWTAEQGWPEQIACGVLGMSPNVYRKVYAKPRFHSKTEWMNKTFPGDETPV